MRRHPDRLDGQQAMNRTNNERNLGMKQTINRISNRVGDWFATLFALTALLLVPHAIIRPIIGYGLHHWIPIQWLALHAMLIILTLCAALTTITLALCTALAGCGGMAKASTPAHAVKPIDSQCTDGGTAHGFYECAITLSDTRKVDCIVYAWGKQGGLSCDWSHVSGADKEPDR